MTLARRHALPELGVGVGLRMRHFGHVTSGAELGVDLFEILTENFLFTEGRPMAILEQVRRDHEIVMHGVSMNLGSTDPLDTTHLRRVKALADRIEAAWVGDHVCWTGVAGRNGHDLYPVPYTEEALAHMVERVKRAQGVLGRPLVLENPSTYLTFATDSMPEVEWIARLAEASDCALLLDVNNVYVTCRNHRLDPIAYLEQVPWERVVQHHLAGHTDHGTHCIDTHDGPVCDEVWALYRWVVEHVGPITTIVEWDGDVPSFDVLEAEVARAKALRG